MLRKLVLMFALAMVINVYAQQKVTSTGVVSDMLGEPVIGATVKVVGTKIATVTDTNGNFTLRGVTAGQKLEISYIGMKAQVASARENMKIVLEDDNSMLDEVVVTAFGEQKRSAFTGSAAVVGAGQIEKKQVTNVLNALQGEAAGVQMTTDGSPTATPTIRIRGFSSINADNDPLIIVDGCPFEGQWNDINPADVESLTVLKDAASAALYGARGANGIIMITTKRAKTGDAVITVDAKWGGSSRIKRDYETIDNVGQYYETYYKGLYNYYKNAKGESALNAHIDANETLGASSSAGGLGYVTMTPPDGEYLIGSNGRLNPNAVLGSKTIYDGTTYTLMPDDWLKEATRTGLRQEYNINANGGNDRTQFYASVGYLKTEGVTVGSDFERYSARLKANYQVKKWLRIGGNANFTHSNAGYVSSSSNNLFSVCQNIAPVYPVYIRDANGNIMSGVGGNLYDYGDGATIGLVRAYQPSYNPIQEVTLNTYNGKSNLFSIDGFAEVSPLDGLKITLKGNVTDGNRKGNYGYNPYYGWSASAYDNGQVSTTKDETYSYNFQQLVNYRKEFGKHNVELLLGHENFKRTYDYLYGTKQGVASYFSNQTLAGAVSVIDTGSTTGSNATDGSNATGYNTEGWFFRALYDYDSKYYGNFSIRRDASSRFHPDHRWGTFFSFGGAWVMTKEDWLKDVSWLDVLKLKASYGQVGNDAIGDFRYMDTYKIINSDGNIGLQVQTIGNKDITWETVGNFNAGFEFELFKGRLTGSIDYFYRKTTDMLCFVRVPMSAGYAGSYKNIGDMVNKGVEMDFNVGIIKTKDLQWNFNINATFFKNKITKIADELKNNESYEPAGYSSGIYFYGEGLPMYTMYIPKYAGVNEQGLSTWYKTESDGTVTTTTSYSEATSYITDDPNPVVYGGFGTSVAYKGFDLSVSFAYSLGGKAYDYGYAALMTNPTYGNTGTALHRDILNAWSEDNTSSDIPRWQFGDMDTAGQSDRFLTNASWLTLSNINLGYTFGSSIAKKLGLSKLRVYVTGENLYYWTARKGFDPRTSFNGSASTSAYSPSRTISGGVTVSF